ncbi:2262_t:CDS:2, partial [Cetraspora pellucida]
RSEGSWEAKRNDADDGSTTIRARSVDQHSKIISNNSIDPMEVESDDLSTLAMQEVIHNSFTTLQIKKHNESNQLEDYDPNDNLNSVPPGILQKTVRTYIQHPTQESHYKNDYLKRTKSSFTKEFRDVEVQTDPIDLTSLEQYLNNIDPSIMNILRKKLFSVGVGPVKPYNENVEPQGNIPLNESSQMTSNNTWGTTREKSVNESAQKNASSWGGSSKQSNESVES